MSVERHGRPSISVVIGDVTTSDCEAIVNAANSELWMGGGVAGAIKFAAGSEVEVDAIALGPIEPGESVVTSAGRLPAPIRWIVHAATMGPDGVTSEDYIRRAMASALAAAASAGARSIATPALGTGVGGFPIERAAQVMLEEIRLAPPGLERIAIVVRSEDARAVFDAALLTADR